MNQLDIQELGFQPGDDVRLQIIRCQEVTDKAVFKTVEIVLAAMRNADFSVAPIIGPIDRMKAALLELLPNAIVHGNKRDKNKKIIIGHCLSENIATVSIMDEGEGFDHQSVLSQSEPAAPTSTSGRGLYIVKQLVDEIRFNKKGNRVLIRLSNIDKQKED